MVRRTKEDAQETHDRIISAAADVFYDKGVGNTTLEDVAKAAGVTRGAIYWHFKNKLDLFSALHSQMHSCFMAQVAEKRNITTDEPLKQLADVCVEILTDFQSNEERRKAMSIFTQKCDYSGDMQPFLDKQNESKTNSIMTIAGFFRQAVDLGGLPANTDCILLANSLSCYMAGIMIENLQCPFKHDLQKQARPMINIFFRGIMP